MSDIIQLKITLQNTKPPIWRRILVDKTTTFQELHLIIQIAMGWYNCHLHEFRLRNRRIGEPSDDDWGVGDSKLIDDSTVKLESLNLNEKEKFKYEYDFGDSWDHQITVEKFLPIDKDIKYPTCIAGKGNCPPEDCGGVWGFYRMLEIINDKKHPERKEMLEWLGGQYDADDFDKKLVNEQLEGLAKPLRSRR